MKAEEKAAIYNLLKTASANLNGFTTPAFSCKEPDWTDDVTKSTTSTNENVQEQGSNLQNISTINNENADNTISSDNQNIPDNKTSTEEKIPLPQNAEISSTGINSSGLTIEELSAKISRCTRCSLARTRNNVVPGMGVTSPDVLVIGEGPGYDEDKQGLPFVGKAGILLDKMLAAIGLDRKTNTYIANIVKCRPPQNRDPFPAEQDACFSFLEAQINILKPKMILCMGKVAGNKLLNMDLPVGQIRGQFYDYHNIPVLVTYHPSALLRNEELKKPAWEDLKKFKAKLDLINQE